MRALRQLHPRLLANVAKFSAAEMFATFVLGMGVAVFLVLAVFAVAIGFGWHFYKRYWEKLAQEIAAAARAKHAETEKADVAKKAEDAKAQPAVDTANEIIRE